MTNTTITLNASSAVRFIKLVNVLRKTFHYNVEQTVAFIFSKEILIEEINKLEMDAPTFHHPTVAESRAELARELRSMAARAQYQRTIEAFKRMDANINGMEPEEK